jgi:hypothetical protein
LKNSKLNLETKPKLRLKNPNSKLNKKSTKKEKKASLKSHNYGSKIKLAKTSRPSFNKSKESRKKLGTMSKTISSKHRDSRETR